MYITMMMSSMLIQMELDIEVVPLVHKFASSLVKEWLDR